MTQASQADRFLVVGIGASAGGVEALRGFFGAVPADSGAAYIVVTHLDPKHRSELAEILRRASAMPVETAVDGMDIKPNRVFVMPEGVHLTVEGLRIRLAPRSAEEVPSQAIDLFLSTLAREHGPYAVAVVLSGASGDGTLGATAVRGAGGLTLAQVSDGTKVRHDTMPNSAIAARAIDLSLPAEDMAARIVAYGRTLSAADAETDAASPSIGDLHREILALIEKVTGHDFSGYKMKTFHRRLMHRMQIAKAADTATYLDRLRESSDEVRALFADLLINVTEFFRDPEAFAALDLIALTDILGRKKRGSPIRIWVPGCATGEEVYSLAMHVLERLDDVDPKPRVQIFATDINEASLQVARGARYRNRCWSRCRRSGWPASSPTTGRR